MSPQANPPERHFFRHLFLGVSPDTGFAIENARHTIQVNVIIVTAIMFLLPFGCYSYYHGARILGIFDMAVAFVLAVSLIIARKGKKEMYAAVITTFAITPLFIYLLLSGAPDNTGPLWIYTFPLIVIPFFGSRNGMFITICFLIFVVLFFIFGDELTPAAYTLDFKIRFFGSFLCVCLLSFFFSVLQTRYEERISERTEDCEAAKEKAEHHEKALKQTEHTWQELVMRCHEGIVLVQDELIKITNDALAGLGDYRIDEIINTPFLRYIADEKLKDVIANYRLRIAGVAVPEEYDSALKHRDGHTVHVRFRAGKILYKGKVADLVFIRPLSEKEMKQDEAGRARGNDAPSPPDTRSITR